MHLSARILAASALLLSACSSSTITSLATDAAVPSQDGSGGAGAKPGNVVQGTLLGQPFTAEDAIFGTSTSGLYAVSPALYVQMSSFANACAAQVLKSGNNNSRILGFALATTDASSNLQPATTPGTYTVVPSGPSAPNLKVFDALFATYTTSCQLADGGAHLDSGTVTVTSLDANTVRGTFDLVLKGTASTDHVTGAFSADACASFAPDPTVYTSCN